MQSRFHGAGGMGEDGLDGRGVPASAFCTRDRFTVKPFCDGRVADARLTHPPDGTEGKLLVGIRDEVVRLASGAGGATGRIGLPPEWDASAPVAVPTHGLEIFELSFAPAAVFPFGDGGEDGHEQATGGRAGIDLAVKDMKLESPGAELVDDGEAVLGIAKRAIELGHDDLADVVFLAISEHFPGLWPTVEGIRPALIGVDEDSIEIELHVAGVILRGAGLGFEGILLFGGGSANVGDGFHGEVFQRFWRRERAIAARGEIGLIGPMGLMVSMAAMAADSISMSAEVRLWPGMIGGCHSRQAVSA